MLPNLTANEARVIGCLMEKSVVTPDQYPLTLNALTNACNQKSSRDPVMALEQGMVQRTARDLGSQTFRPHGGELQERGGEIHTAILQHAPRRIISSTRLSSRSSACFCCAVRRRPGS